MDRPLPREAVGACWWRVQEAARALAAEMEGSPSSSSLWGRPSARRPRDKPSAEHAGRDGRCLSGPWP